MHFARDLALCDHAVGAGQGGAGQGRAATVRQMSSHTRKLEVARKNKAAKDSMRRKFRL